jgi:hypothetical protein
MMMLPSGLLTSVDKSQRPGTDRPPAAGRLRDAGTAAGSWSAMAGLGGSAQGQRRVYETPTKLTLWLGLRDTVVPSEYTNGTPL